MKKLSRLLSAGIVGTLLLAACNTQPGQSGTSSSSAAAEDPRVTSARTMLVGTWSSEDDRNVLTEYKADGTVVESVGTTSGEKKTQGKWSLFTADNAPNVAFQLNNKDVYMTQSMENGGDVHFRIMSVTPTELEMMNMETATAQRFGKLTTGHEMTDGDEGGTRLRATHICDDESYFVATFADAMDEVTIDVDGEVVATLPHVTSASGQKFANDQWEYFFKGESAIVTDKKTGKTKNCKPPFDPNNAPVNVGD